MKLLGFILASLYFFLCVYFPATLGNNWHFINNIDLIIHEAGHTFVPTFLLGEVVTALGGSLFQILVPIMFAIYFLKRNDTLSFSILMMWAAENIAYVSVYIADSIKLQIPLLGGDGSIHDWNFILGKWNLLVHAELIGKIVYCLSWVLFLYVFFVGIVSLKKINSKQ